MKNLKIIIFIILIIFFTVTCIILISKNSNYEIILINNIKYKTEIAKTHKQREKGLSGRKSLNGLDGMLFIYPQSMQVGYWMKDMYFDIDIVWIKNNKIIGFEKNISYLDQEKIYHSPGLVDSVLEFKSQTIEKNNIKTGDNIIYY